MDRNTLGRSLLGILTAAVLTGAAGVAPAVATPAAASETCVASEFAEAVEAGVLADLSSTAPDGVEIDEVSIDPTSEVLDFYACDPTAAIEDITNYTLPAPSGSDIGGIDIAPMATANYTASVWAGVPALGNATVYQKFRATVTSGKISGVSMTGSSYMTGITIGTWSASNSTVTYRNAGKQIRINISGTLSYGIPGTPLNVSNHVTFADYFKGSGGSLVDCNCGAW